MAKPKGMKYMELMSIKILNTAIENILNRELAEFDITYTQATVIGFLNQNRDHTVCQRDIETRLGLTHPTVSSILNRLEEKRMVRTEPLAEDRRYKKIELTEASQHIADQIQEKINRISRELLQGVTPKEEKGFIKTLNLIIRNIK
ncbi:MAG: MarR family transcriptional regulator [Clostridiales bacterium]|nr:MarR family transcriptional regulator [Clostridiales bacterium]